MKNDRNFLLGALAVTAMVYLLLVLASCGPPPTPEYVQGGENINVREIRLTNNVIRLIDVETGVVCFHGNGGDWGYCFLLSETKLDY